MTIEERMQTDLVAAMKAGEAVKRDTLRFAKTALKNEAVAKAHALSDDEAEQVVARVVKQLTQAAVEFEQVGNAEQAAAERAQAELLKPYLPAPLTDEELMALIDAAMSEMGAVGPADMGKVMAALKSKVGTRADGATVANLVKARLAA